MRIALFGDIHANLEALEAVLDDAAKQHVTDYVCMGDIVGYNADPAACLERVRASHQASGVPSSKRTAVVSAASLSVSVMAPR